MRIAGSYRHSSRHVFSGSLSHRVRDEAGSFEKVSDGGQVLRDHSAMVAEREALRMGIERLAVFLCRQKLAYLILRLKT